MAEAGWYRVEGDPPGTKRRWNGEQWIGVPVLQEPSADNVAAVAAGQKLSSTGSAMAVVAVVGMVVQMVVIGSLALRLHRAVDTIPDNYFVIAGISDIADFVPGMTWHVVAILALALIITGAFVRWLGEVVEATQALTSAQMRRMGMGGSAGGIAAFIVPIFLLLGPLFTGLFVVVSRRPKQGAPRQTAKQPSLVNTLNRVIERLNAGSQRDVGPIKVLVWWVLLCVPILVGIGTWLWAVFRSSRNVDAMPTVLRIYEILLVLGLVSLVAIISTVVAITQRLGLR